jgi:predicted TIM-barrel fold metal-dependent hydrolase
VSTQLDVIELRMRAFECLAKHATANEWRDVDNIIHKAKMISDFCMDARKHSAIEKRVPKAPSKVKA